MSNGSKQDYLSAIRSRYLTANKSEKKAILDEFCTVCGCNRKYAIRVLRRPLQKSSFSPKSQTESQDQISSAGTDRLFKSALNRRESGVRQTLEGDDSELAVVSSGNARGGD